ncbi:MAG: hypothetical protein ACREV3_14015, partial [Gammaproteobacteria bacterium]
MFQLPEEELACWRSQTVIAGNAFRASPVAASISRLPIPDITITERTICQNQWTDLLIVNSDVSSLYVTDVCTLTYNNLVRRPVSFGW